MEKGKGAQMLSYEIQTGPPCLPNLWFGLGAAGSDLDCINRLYLINRLTDQQFMKFISKRRNTKSTKSFYWVMRSPSFLNTWWSFGPVLVLDFDNSLSKGITCVDFVSINLTCYQQLTEDQLQLRNLSALDYRRNTRSQIRNPKQWEASQLKGRVTGVQTSCKFRESLNWTHPEMCY